MPDFFKRLSFKKKILSSYILFIIISCFLIGVYFLKSMENAKEESLSYMCQFSEQVSMSTDVIISNVDRIRFMHFIDDTIKYIIRRSMSDKTMAELIDENNYMERALNHMTNMNQYVLRATLINEYREVYSNVQTNNEAYLKKMEAIDSRQDWADKNKVWYTGVYEEEINLIPFELVTSISKVYDMNQEENIGTLYIDLNFSNIRQMLDRLVESRTSRTKLLIFDKNQNVIYDSDGEEQAFWNQMNSAEESAVRHFLETGISKDNELVIYGEKCLVSDIWNQTTGWQIFTWTPLSDIYVSGWNNMVTIISAMLLLLVAAVFLGIYLANQISRPVLILAEAMEQVDQGKVNLLEQKEQDWQDEMGMLFRSYNEMGKRINDSIEKIYIYQINQKQTELKMLQFQINPHFLYNTLNTISSIAALSDIDDIVKIADNLSGMFQYNIKGDDIVPVGKEIQHVKNYLEIQAIRFPGKYQFEYQIAPKIEQQKMLKFLLQPLAENSLQHAFVKMKKINKICITVEEQGEDILFRLCDNGVGMRAKQVEALNLELAQTDTRTLVNHVDKGIGLRNVNARIKNLYGKEYGIQVRSEEGCYTEVRIKIRRIGEEDTF
ncbi:sensor histidine kinase BtsS [Lachnospiraceae bacterium]|nr:sensor histidine kinase BtsS [Lachnospiraceae bacterium]